MNLYQLIQNLQKSKTINHSLTTKDHAKLTQEQQQAIDIGSGASTLTLSELYDAIDNNLLSIGSYYLIENVNTDLYGGTNIILQAVNTNQLNKKGYGQFYNPRYDLYNVWDQNASSYNNGDKVIYGGYVWINNSGNVGNVDNSNEEFNLDENWSIQLYTNIDYYNEVWDEIEYDINEDIIYSRYEDINKNLVSNSYESYFWGYCGINPIKVFRWGHKVENSQGVGSCTVINSIFDCINIVSGTILGVKLNNYSIFFALNMINSSWIGNVNLDNYSFVAGISLDNSNIYNLNMDNSSYENINYINASLNNIKLYSSNLYFNNASIISYTIGGINCGLNTIEYQFGITFDGSIGFGGITGSGPTSLNLPYMPIPQGYFVESILLEGLSTFTGNENSTIRFGYSNGTGLEILDNTTGLLPTISGLITYNNILNNKITPTSVSVANIYLVGSILNNPFNSGTLNIEIKFKKINNTYITFYP